MQEFYDITVAGVKRSLPVVPINENMSIAGFVIFGDTDVVEPCARALAEKLPPETEVLVTAEAKSIPLIYEMAKVMKMPRYVIARKSVKGYMRNPIITTVNSITNMGKEQILVVDEHDAEFIKGKKVAIIDDVISTGSSIEAIEKLVKEAEDLHMILDLSHLSDEGVEDVLSITSCPVIASHSNCRALCDVRRNLTDEQLRAIRDTGGVVGVNVSHDFVHKEPRQQTAAMLARHAAHMAEVMGPEHVACGFDFCEYFGPGYEGCEGMEDCGQAQNFIFELERIGFSEAERQAIASENLLRVLE